jgi:hypothetical protein
MKLCSLCERIKEVRERQSKDYYQDLCSKCQVKVSNYRQNNGGERKVIRLVF